MLGVYIGAFWIIHQVHGGMLWLSVLQYAHMLVHLYIN